MSISYSLCWEDPSILLDALNISNQDSVLSISSGGENLFAMILKNPKNLTGIDINKEQIYLAKLKISAIKLLSFEEFVKFLGFKASNNRKEIFSFIKKDLDNEVIIYWEENIKLIENGIIHCGKFERYLEKFRKHLLPLIISKKRIKELLSLNPIEKQKDFYNKFFDNWRFRLVFKLFFSRKGLESGRNKEYFRYSSKKKISNYYLEKVKHGLTEIPIKNNFFMHYILTGTIPTPFYNHPYLDKKNFIYLKEILNNSKKIEFINEDIYNFLKKEKTKSFSKYNLSDVFEVKTQREYEDILKEIVRISDQKGILCYWNNLVPRYKHDKIPKIKKDNLLSSRLSKKDRVHFYSRFIVEKINSNKI